MALLNHEQRACVESIGFGSALNMRLGKLPCILSYLVVDRYSPTTNSIPINGQILVITREIIHDIYGKPMGDIPMCNPAKAKHEDNVVHIWKAQFPCYREDYKRLGGWTIFHYEFSCFVRISYDWVPVYGDVILSKKIKHIFNTYYQAMEDLDVWLMIEQQNFPESAEIRTLIKTRNHEFNLTYLNFATNLTCGIIPTPHANKHHEVDPNEGIMKNDDSNDIMACTPLTQLLTTEEEYNPKVLDTEAPDSKDLSIHTWRRSKRIVKVTDKI
ncbi:hypothetical protein LXL04_020426 [Taraxacum kok-saghyz]